MPYFSRKFAKLLGQTGMLKECGAYISRISRRKFPGNITLV